jgi:hypothetical protein
MRLPSRRPAERQLQFDHMPSMVPVPADEAMATSSQIVVVGVSPVRMPANVNGSF